MEVTAKYELIGLMAYPIRHSLSPTMQNCALEKMGLPICYMAFEVDNASFPDAIKGLRALKMRGTGVSMPNKQLAIEYVDELDPAAELAGAINTIVNKDGRLIGYNTDGTGHLHGIKETGFDPKGKTMAPAALPRPSAPAPLSKASRKSSSSTARTNSGKALMPLPSASMKRPTASLPFTTSTTRPPSALPLIPPTCSPTPPRSA